MNTSRYSELVSLYMDGEPSEEELNELAELLKTDEVLARDFQDQLIAWEAWSQETAPERSAEAFQAGIHTRLRAEKDAPAFELSITNKLKQRRLPLPFHPMIAVAATAALILIFTQVMLHSSKGPETAERTASTHICVHGECICTRCTLNQTEEHLRAIRYRGANGKPEIVLLKNNPEMDMKMRYFCKGPTPVLVEGDVDDEGGLTMLIATAFRTFEQDPDQYEAEVKEAIRDIKTQTSLQVAINDYSSYNLISFERRLVIWKLLNPEEK